ncbi:MAG TPA: transglutaminase-like cysteine peptidase [Pseudomonadales bacterium]
MGRGIAIGAAALIVTLALLTPNPAEADFRFEDGVYLGPATRLADWADTLARARKQQPLLDSCLADIDRCSRRLRGLHVLVARARDLTPEQQIRLVNRYVNKRSYRRDRWADVQSAVAGQPVRVRSRWSTLVEFMLRGGDCEDYATSKYQLLRELGFAADDLRVVVAFDRDSREHHGLLAVRRPDGDVWLLDSDDSIHRSHPFGYRFVYALNETSIWDHELGAETWSQILESSPEESS